MEFIKRPQLPEGLAALVAQLRAKQNDPIAAGIMSATRDIAGGFSDRFDAKNRANLAEDERVRQIMSGLIAQGSIPIGNTSEIRGMLSDKTPREIRRPKAKADEDILNDQEINLMSSALKLKPEQLKGVRKDVAKSLFPQYFFDPNTGKTVEAPKGSKIIPPSPTDKPATEGERLTRGFADRANQAQDELATLVSGGYDPTALFSTRGDLVPNAAKGESDQMAEQAMRNFVSAVLRKESGAVIPPDELKSETLKYFPMRGDKPGVVAQKERARAQAIKNLIAGAGKAPSTYTKPGAKADSVAAAGGQTAESIRAAFKAGEITREQAKAQISALGGFNGR